MGNIPCIFLITYSFSNDPVVHFCRNREQAEKIREYYITEEERVVKEEQQYQPYIDRTSYPDSWVLWYGEYGDYSNFAEYSILSEDKCTSHAKEQLKLRGIIQ